MAYVEVKAKTVEMAVEAAMRELGVSERDRLDVEVLQEPERGFLGFGGQDAIVKVAERSGRSGKGRNRGRGGSGRKGGQERGRQQSGGGVKQESKPERPANQRSKNRPNEKSGDGGGQGKGKSKKKEDDRDPLSVDSQEPLVRDFLAGLVESFGLEGEVETSLEDDVIVAQVVGDQTEALVGPRGAVMEAVHELTKTVLQRTAQDSARVRLDIAGYAERRRQALTIYAGELIKQVSEDGGELMLEPMSASDRKVIHDAVAEHDSVRSYSEGESPRRYVVIAAVASGDDEDSGAGEEE